MRQSKQSIDYATTEEIVGDIRQRQCHTAQHHTASVLWDEADQQWVATLPDGTKVGTPEKATLESFLDFLERRNQWK